MTDFGIDAIISFVPRQISGSVALHGNPDAATQHVGPDEMNRILSFFIIFFLSLSTPAYSQDHSIILGVEIPESYDEAEPEKVIRNYSEYGLYFAIAVWGGRHVVRDLWNGNITRAISRGEDVSAFAMYAYCHDQPDEIEGFVKFGYVPGPNLANGRHGSPGGLLGKCLRAHGYDTTGICDRHDEGCAFIRESAGCFVNVEWVEWATRQYGRPLDPASDWPHACRDF